MKKLFFIALAFSALFGCSSTEQIQSHSSENSVIIDGNDAEWRNHMHYYKDQNISVGVMHDTQNLYLCIGTQDESTEQMILKKGLNIWFDGKGGTDEVFGIHFPIRPKPNMSSENFQSSPRFSPENINSSEEGFNPHQKPDFNKLLENIEIIQGENKDPIQLRLSQTGDLKIKMGKSDGATVVELQIPLKKSDANLYAISSDGQSPIGIGIVTAEMEEQMQQGPRGGGNNQPGGAPGMGGNPGMGGPPRGNMPPDHNNDDDSGIELWLMANLSLKK